MDERNLFFALVVIFIDTSITMFISSIYNYNINHFTLEKNTQISRIQFQKLSFCSSDVLGTFLYKKSHVHKIF